MPLITFKCRLVSPLHTAAERYSNVQTCAPYLLGSTLRGAMLGQIIRRRCPAEHFHQLMGDNPGYHAKCPGPCGARPLFDPTRTRFSFGRFPRDNPPRAFRSRVAIDRERGSVARGALLQFEIIPLSERDGRPTCFDFEVEVPDDVPAELVREAVTWAGEAGVGAFRNQGFGRFIVEGTPAIAEPAADGARPPGTYLLTCDTPYVLPPGLPFGETSLRGDFDARLGAGWSNHHLGPVKVKEANLGYVGRWCYESDEAERQTRAVALPGSLLSVAVTSEITPEDAARMLRGIGQWAEFGFGRFTINPAPAV
jgi:hypothetical protein